MNEFRDEVLNVAWLLRMTGQGPPGAHLGAFLSKSIESNGEMNEFRDEVLNVAWLLRMTDQGPWGLSGSVLI